MNALPVGPEQVAKVESRDKYFNDLDRWGFDMAYNVFDARTYDDAAGGLREAYTSFAEEAHKRGYPACIQIESTKCAGDRVGIEEAQYDIDNNPDRCGEGGFLASFSSSAWKDYLKEITELFVRRYGYDYVVFGEPICRADIPGTKDRFHEGFARAYPDVRYPQRREETSAYLLIQQEKARAITEFFADLVDHAKSVGAKKVGFVPSSFVPTPVNTPEGTLNSSCNANYIARIPGLDFLVTRTQPKAVYNDQMRTGDELQKSPVLLYMEILAHALGKDVIAVSGMGDKPSVPCEFLRDATLAAIAAAPNGFACGWSEDKAEDGGCPKALAEAASFASRLGRPVSSVAFVFSYSGTRHAEPFTCETVFSHYWALAKELAVKSHLPMLTFHAETLKEDLAAHPEVKVLVFEENFPLTVEQMMAIRGWWEGDERRSVVAFGSGLGFTADIALPGPAPAGQAYPGVLELIGLKQEEPQVIALDESVTLKDVSRVRRKAFLADGPVPGLNKIANVRRVFGSRANVLYETEINSTAIPVVTEYRDRTTLALFCGFGLSSITADAAEKAIRYALDETHCPPPVLDDCSKGILWNLNKNDYLVISNLSDEEGHATAKIGRGFLWDCREHKLITEQEPRLTVAPRSFAIYRVLTRRSKFLDLIGASCLRRVVDGAGRAEIEILAGRSTLIVLRASPREITVDGKSCIITQEVKNGAYYVTLQQCPPGEHMIALRW